MNVEPWNTLTTGDTGSAVTGMQYLLRAQGSGIGADGAFGPMTAEAVRQFQQARNLPVDGDVGPITWPQLVIPTSSGANGDAVRGVQSFGLALVPESDPLVVDGTFGPTTDDRVRLFQRLWGLTADGVAGRETWSYLTADRAGLWPLVKPGATEETNFRVRAVQYLLRAHGFDVAADGVYGPATGEAVRQFDSAHRAVFVSSTVGSLTWPALVIVVGPGSTGDAVRAVQTVFPGLAVDGSYGPATEARVRDFQTMFGVSGNGVTTLETWHTLMVPKSE